MSKFTKEPVVHSKSCRVSTFLATGFGVGYAPIASGTFGTVLAVGLAIGLRYLFPFFETVTGAVLLAVGTTGLACLVSEVTLKNNVFGEGNSDPKPIVIDEVAGYFVTIVGHASSIEMYIISFFLFRLFDIWKPYPASSLENLPGGYGVVLDDIAAGLYANISCFLILYFFM